jgi:hypothetical protein
MDTDIEGMPFADAVLKLTDKKNIEDLTQVEYAAVVNIFGSKKRKDRFADKQFGDKIEEAAVESRTYKSLETSIQAKSMQNLQKSFEDIRNKVSEEFSLQLGGKQLTAGVLERVAAVQGATEEVREQNLDEAAFLLAEDTGMSQRDARILVGQMSGGDEVREAVKVAGGVLSAEDLSRIEDLGQKAKQTKFGGKHYSDLLDKAQAGIISSAKQKGVVLTEKQAREAAIGYFDKARTGREVYGGIGAFGGKTADILTEIRDFQSLSGARARREQLLVHIEGMKPTTPEEKLVRENLRTASEKLDSPEGILDLTRAEIDALGKSTFKDIAAPAAGLAEMRKKADALARNPNSAENKLALKESLQTFSDTYKIGLSTGDIDSVIQSTATQGASGLGRLAQEVTTRFAPDTGITGAPGGTGAATQTGTAMEAYNVQTNINRSILMALKSLAVQLPTRAR